MQSEPIIIEEWSVVPQHIEDVAHHLREHVLPNVAATLENDERVGDGLFILVIAWRWCMLESQEQRLCFTIKKTLL